MRKVLSLLAFSLVSIAGTCQTTHTAVLSWGASATAGATYTVLQASSASGPFTTVKAGIPDVTFTVSGLPASTQVCFEVIASSTGNTDSDPSNVVCGTTGANQTAAPGVLTVIFK